MKDILAGLFGLAGVGLALWVGIVLLTVPQGPQHCEAAFRQQGGPDSASPQVFQTMWTRTLKDHWIAAIVLQPEDITRDPFTVVCHFAATNFALKELQFYDGDRTKELKRISMSNIDPRTWLK